MEFYISKDRNKKGEVRLRQRLKGHRVPLCRNSPAWAQLLRVYSIPLGLQTPALVRLCPRIPLGAVDCAILVQLEPNKRCLLKGWRKIDSSLRENPDACTAEVVNIHLTSLTKPSVSVVGMLARANSDSMHHSSLAEVRFTMHARNI